MTKKFLTSTVVVLVLFFLASPSLSTTLSVSESAVIDPEKELAETVLDEESQKVFGSNLFRGNFRNIEQPSFNQEYIINIGDMISIRIWGAFELSIEIPVDSQGNIFLPKVGTVQVLGVKNKDLVTVVEDAIKKSYKDLVFIYANVANYQPITVFVTGNVNLPGLYKGMSSDSILQFIDRAGGISLKYGSFRNVDIVRSGKIIKNCDLYSFLVDGKRELFQFKNGDVISVNSIMYQVEVDGDVKRPFRFEFAEPAVSLKEVLKLAMLRPETTNFTISRWQRNNTQQFISGSLGDAATVRVLAGDTIDFFSDHTSQLKKINVTGEHDGLSTILIRKEATLGDVLGQLQLNPRSNPGAVQVFRKSVAEQQKQLLLAHLQKLEAAILTASSMTPEESQIRNLENESYLSFIERAKQVEPKGQIIINPQTDPQTVFLEEDDQIYIPSITNLALVQGEVSIPGTHTFVDGLSAHDYIDMSGGFTEMADEKNILVIAQNGSIKRYKAGGQLKGAMVRNGDSILVMPEIEGKNLQIAKGITQIMYQIAVSVGVIVAL